MSWADLSRPFTCQSEPVAASRHGPSIGRALKAASAPGSAATTADPTHSRSPAGPRPRGARRTTRRGLRSDRATGRPGPVADRAILAGPAVAAELGHAHDLGHQGPSSRGMPQWANSCPAGPRRVGSDLLVANLEKALAQQRLPALALEHRVRPQLGAISSTVPDPDVWPNRDHVLRAAATGDGGTSRPSRITWTNLASVRTSAIRSRSDRCHRALLDQTNRDPSEPGPATLGESSAAPRASSSRAEDPATIPAAGRSRLSAVVAGGREREQRPEADLAREHVRLEQAPGVWMDGQRPLDPGRPGARHADGRTRLDCRRRCRGWTHTRNLACCTDERRRTGRRASRAIALEPSTTGPGADTARILDELAEHGAKATFFVVGSRGSRDAPRELLARIAAEGHELGSHSWSHGTRPAARPGARRGSCPGPRSQSEGPRGVFPRWFRPALRAVDARRGTGRWARGQWGW